MSTGRIIAAGLVGGIAVFFWGAFIHEGTPLGEMGIKSMPPALEESVVPQFKKELTAENSFYFIPGMPDDKSDKAREAWTKKIEAGPTGLLLFHPGAGQAMSPKQLVVEFITNVIAALILAVLLARWRTTIGGGAIIGLAIGFFGWVSIEASYWNWYGYPSNYELAALIEQCGGGFIGGLVVALVLGKPKAVTMPK